MKFVLPPVEFDLTETHSKKDSIERFLDNQLTVRSRSGLNRAEARWLHSFEEPNDESQSWLFANAHGGTSAMAISKLYPKIKASVWNLDLHHHRQVTKRLERFKMDQVKAEVGSKPPAGFFDRVIWFLQDHQCSKELFEDLFHQFMSRLNAEGRLFIVVDGSVKKISNRVKTTIKKFSLLESDKQGGMLVIPKPKKALKSKNHLAKVELILPEFRLPLYTQPGVFAHRQLDSGTLALAEIVTAKEGQKVVELGAGHGGVGLSVALRWRLKRLVLADTYSRARDMAQYNAEKLDVQAECCLSDGSDLEERGFDLFIGNPPYFSQMRIAKHFIDQARRLLAPKGRLFMVSKRGEVYRDLLGDAFKDSVVTKRRSYDILMARRV